MKNKTGPDDDVDRELSRQMSRAYAMTPQDEPSAAIDAAILAQAQAAVRGAKGYGVGAHGSVAYKSDRRWFHWGPPMATAALLVLSTSLVMWMEREQPEVLTVSRPVTEESSKARGQPAGEPVPGQASPASKTIGPYAAGRQRSDSVAVESGAPDEPAKAAPVTTPEPRIADSRIATNREALPLNTEAVAAAPSAVPAAPSPFTPPATPAAAIASAERAGSGLPPGTATGSPQSLAQSQPARLATAPAAAERRSLRAAEGAGNFAASRDAKQQESPQAWLARIAELRKQGRLKEAEESLAEFRKRYPEYPIPAQGSGS